jgi:predicted RNA-binding protein with PIN domain
MSARILLIDGYNLLHAAGLGKLDYKPGELLYCRTSLLRLLLNKLSIAEIRTTTVIFDARDPPPDRPSEIHVSGLRVRFANPGGDADVMIRHWLAVHPTPRRVTLISSDKELQRAARGCGSQFTSSQKFLDEIEARRKGREAGRPSADDDDKPEITLGGGQVDYWLNEFGEFSIVEPDPEPPHEVASTEPPPTADARPEEAPRRGKPRRRKTPRSDDVKPGGSIDAAELAEWLHAFGPEVAGLEPSTDECRRAELEKWLEQEQAEEKKQP